MDAQAALAELQGVSTQLGAIVLMSREGTVEAATIPEQAAASAATAAAELVARAEATRGDLGRDALAQLQVATPEGCVFVVLDGRRAAVATTGADPTVGLVFYDLKSLLRDLGRSEHAAAEGAKA